jgi:hypothetical protein
MLAAYPGTDFDKRSFLTGCQLQPWLTNAMSGLATCTSVCAAEAHWPSLLAPANPPVAANPTQVAVHHLVNSTAGFNAADVARTVRRLVPGAIVLIKVRNAADQGAPCC